jgi:hypothetical protein
MHYDGSSNGEGAPDPSGGPFLNPDRFSSPLFSQCFFYPSRHYFRLSLSV